MPDHGSTSATITGSVVTGGSAPRDCLILVTSPDQVSAHSLNANGTLVFGRGQECDVVLDSKLISRRHALLRASPVLEVVDFRSKNGTIVGGTKIEPGAKAVLGRDRSFRIGPFAVVVIPANRTGAVPAHTEFPAGLTIRDPMVPGNDAVILRIAGSGVTVVLGGETGVGKEVLAQRIHELSGRAGPFLGINCAALQDGLLESELFGHARGAFTGASSAKPGLLEIATGGTVFLDEIGDLSPQLQAKLLRVLETRQILRVGGVNPIDLDVRFLTATHKDLAREVDQGRFRQDLYYRLNGITLFVAPLRERGQAIIPLAQRFIAEAAAVAERAPATLTPAAVGRLMSHTWPGNVRELRAVVERAMLLAEEGEIEPRHLLIEAAAPAATSKEDLNAERETISAALQACAGNQTRAAKLLGLSRSTLVHRLDLLGLPRPRRRK